MRMTFKIAELEQRDDSPVGDQVTHLRGSFELYESLLRERGDKSVPRISYLEGNIIIVTPSLEHEEIKSLIGCLIDTYCMWSGKRFRKIGSWTLKERPQETGLEPDECYVFDGAPVTRPDLAIEVIWTYAGVDKLEIYRKLRVQEVWIWQRGRITIHGLAGDRYEVLPSSRVLAGIEIDTLIRFIERPSAFDAIADYRAHLESRGTR